MTKESKRRLFLLVAAASAAVGLGSWTRGYGRPQLTRTAAVVPEWRSYSGEPREIVGGASTTHVVLFYEFQCKACSDLYARVIHMREEGYEIQVTLRHFPRPERHPFARGAAVAVECARDQGKADQMIDQIFKEAASVGLVGWWSFGRPAGVKDSAMFAKCLVDGRVSSRIDDDISAGRSLGIVETPVLLVDSLRLAEPATVEAFSATISRLAVVKTLGRVQIR